jgi:conjugal transfer pilus assembly protein TraE
MDISIKKDEVQRLKQLLRITTVWGVVVSVCLILLTVLSIYILNNNKTHWLPVCVSNDISIGRNSYTNGYLREMVNRVTELRLNYSPNTIDERFETLVHLSDVSKQQEIKQILKEESQNVKKRNITSSFYIKKIDTDNKTHVAMIYGELYRSIHDHLVRPENKKYLISFNFKSGVIALSSIKEVSNEK